MEEKIIKSVPVSQSEVEQKREWDELIAWCEDKERDFPLVEAFLAAMNLGYLLTRCGASERLIESAYKIANRLEDKVRALKGPRA
jgi:hypothetical protein